MLDVVTAVVLNSCDQDVEPLASADVTGKEASVSKVDHTLVETRDESLVEVRPSTRVSGSHTIGIVDDHAVVETPPSPNLDNP